ncbi:hypothetical protein BpHYR1_042130 [Brachionus plicatilis]|uniref:Uncharacterized protein n=1 Tax=Brachionus plicatilis TaxID=10195 RepID=A0A3M7R2C1_BRAPC|nr:hypothetical protein BpHYR1_042130 [Brachionus plicatilis]
MYLFYIKQDIKTNFEICRNNIKMKFFTARTLIKRHDNALGSNWLKLGKKKEENGQPEAFEIRQKSKKYA